MLNEGIRPGEEGALMPVFAPTHEVRRPALDPLDSKNDCFAVGLSDTMIWHQDLVSDSSSHVNHPLSSNGTLALDSQIGPFASWGRG